MVCQNLLKNDVIFIKYLLIYVLYFGKKTFTGHYIVVIGTMSSLPSQESKDCSRAPCLAHSGKLK